MVNTGDFIKRLEKLLDFHGLSASAFADKVKVQRSSISHLLAGRNKPSLEFVLKVTKAFPEVNLYWLLNGEGSFPSSAPPAPPPSGETPRAPGRNPSARAIQKIVIFYSDGSFEAFDKGVGLPP